MTRFYKFLIVCAWMFFTQQVFGQEKALTGLKASLARVPTPVLKDGVKEDGTPTVLADRILNEEAKKNNTSIIITAPVLKEGIKKDNTPITIIDPILKYEGKNNVQTACFLPCPSGQGLASSLTGLQASLDRQTIPVLKDAVKDDNSPITTIDPILKYEGKNIAQTARFLPCPEGQGLSDSLTGLQASLDRQTIPVLKDAVKNDNSPISIADPILKYEGKNIAQTARFLPCPEGQGLASSLTGLQASLDRQTIPVLKDAVKDDNSPITITDPILKYEGKNNVQTAHLLPCPEGQGLASSLTGLQASLDRQTIPVLKDAVKEDNSPISIADPILKYEGKNIAQTAHLLPCPSGQGLTGSLTGLQARDQLISSDHYAKNLAFFCRQELKLEKAVKIPLRFRVGSLEQCNRLEGK